MMSKILPAFAIALIGCGVLLAGLCADPSPVAAESGIACTAWTQVNDGAFGLGEGVYPGYNGEEGFEVAVFKGRLYLGMEADSGLGARLWRTRSQISVPLGQADWEEVIADAAGLPWGVVNIPQVDHVDSVAVFQDALYVSSANSRPSGGTLVFRSTTAAAGSWEQVAPAGFGDPNNINFKDMQVFDGRLCGGTQNWITGAQVWCTADGREWQQANLSGFGRRSRVEVWSGHVFRGALYFGVQDYGANGFTAADDVAMLFRTADLDGTPVWRQVYVGPPGSYRVDILGDLYGYLYISHRSPAGIVILRSPSGQADSWQQVNIPGMDGNPRRMGTVVDGATVYGGALYVAVSDTTAGLTVWRTIGAPADDGTSVLWEPVAGPGIVDPANIYAELIPFNGHLYAWTSNYKAGQQVLRAKCGAVPVAPAPGGGAGQITGRVWYDAADDGYNALPDQGIGGVWVELAEAGSDGVFGTPDDVSYPGATTGPDGRFYLSGLPAGRYRLDVREDTLPPQFAPLRPADGGLYDLVLAADGQAYVPLPYVLVASASLSGHVWHDANGNGWWDGAEEPLPGVIVRLYYAGLDGIYGTADDFAKQLAQTDQHGRYTFADLPAGRYRAAIAPDQLPPDMVPTVDWFDHDQIFLQEGQTLAVADFGFAQAATGVLEGVVWEDRDRDGVCAPDEPGLAGVLLQLISAGPDDVFDTADDTFFPMVATDAQGVYRFRHLVPGRYMAILLSFTLPPGYYLPGGPYSVPYDLAQGQYLTGADFGLLHDYYELALAVAATPPAVIPGDPVTYTITVTNTGTITATRFSLTALISACPGGLNREAEPPGWACTWAQEHGCLYAHCEKGIVSLGPATTAVLSQTIHTLPTLPAEVESVQAQIAIAGDEEAAQMTLVTPVIRPPAALEGFIRVEGTAQAPLDITTTGVFVTATDVETGAQMTVFADQAGRYRIGDLAGGVYRVDVPRDIGLLAVLASQPVTLTLRYGQVQVQDFVYGPVANPVVYDLWATTAGKGVHLGWRADDQGRVDAYRVWRGPASTGPFQPVSALIPQAGVGGQALYAWLDPRPGNERWYLLELLPAGRRIGPVFAGLNWQPRVFLPMLMADSVPPRP